MDGTFAVEPSDRPWTCALCHRALSSENDAIDLEAISICGDCKFLFLEDSGTPSQDIQSQDIQRTPPRLRRTRYNTSSESIENMFSQQFSNMINLARHNQPTVSEIENQSVDSVQRSSSRTTPTGSRRWRWIFSDTESDGFDSVYAESDVSYGAYGVDSDASVDGHSFRDNDMFSHPVEGSVLDSDTDIDPMNAGLNQWNSDADDEDEEDNEWEEVETGEHTLGSLVARVGLRRLLESDGQNPPVNWLTDVQEAAVRVRISETRPGNWEDQETSPSVGNSGDYVDARTFEELLERLAGADSSRRGAPPAALSFMNNLERVNVNEDSVTCAICKDSVPIGTVVNQLPCLHLYHPSCIKPWLSARNTCPLCRYELPTDDRDYENRKRSSNRLGIQRRQHQGMDEDEDEDEEEDNTSSEDNEAPEIMNHERGRWFFLAAPIVSLVGIALVLWLGNPRARGRRHDAVQANQMETRSRRWWSLF